MEYYYSRFSSPVGILHLISNANKLSALIFDANWPEFSAEFKFKLTEKKDKIICESEKQLKEYFNKQRKTFDLPLEYSGTDFQNQAWRCLQKIPYGKTISYGEQARKMKNPKAVRAVGGANGQNRISIIIPCHRVIGKNGALTGFGGGIKIKKMLLKFENPEILCER